ncbi:MAG: tRNA pseudouridine(55) synthase TruB [Acidobacteria bacterium]|nr:tRNA pseudouridine(55) synthase TruB [Acidobacteriota bacterium]
MDGIILVDKSSGWTSHDVVNRMRRIASTRRTGHLGTLDPMATGVLPLVVGRATRLSQFFVKTDKVYEGTIRFGQATNTYDSEGEPLGEAKPFLATPESVEPLLAAFRGTISQMPPPVSAKKINGQPAYKLARKNLPVELKAVEVTVHDLTLLGCDGPDVTVRVHCSSGTYLRAIAHDAGQAAGVGAHLTSLRRLRAGDFVIEQARTLDELQELSAQGRLGEALLPCAALLPEFPVCPVDRLTESQIRQGRDFRTSPFRTPTGARYVKAVGEDGALVALGEAVLPNLYHPMLVL